MVGILGGIGSGKSSVVRHIDGLSFQIIDADKIGHDLLSIPHIQTQIRQQFGNDVFDEHSSVNRAKLAEHVFGDTPKQSAALKQLNSILHPAIRREILSQIKAAPTEVDAVILDAALLLEGGWDETCNWLIFVDTPRSIRSQRVQANRGWTDDELHKREATQLSVKVKKDRADFVVDNSQSIDRAAAQMKQVFNSILSKH